MSKQQTIFTCSNCDAQFTKWTGRCFECGKWGSVEQQAATTSKPTAVDPSTPVIKTSAVSSEGANQKRQRSGIGELDRVLGGGFVPGSFILLGGEPGIGKSTLAIQLATLVPQSLYISGEESVEQVSMRATRLGLKTDTLQLANATHCEAIVSTIMKEKPAVAVVDSIQTLYSQDVPSEPGNVSQIRACATKLLEAAKSSGTAIVLIGHVTKDGNVAGPRTLEHLVDTVLYLEGDRHHQMRLLRAVKNRFGSTDEVGVFDMTEKGLTEVSNPSELLLAERGDDMPGSVVTCLLEGTRPLLVEVQALVNKTAFGYPVRKASGFDINRLHVLIAVLERRAGLALGQYDVHVNVVGGIKANEPASDLAVALAVASAFKDKALGKDLVVFGEVGLGGEVRSVRQQEKRMKECEQLGMKRVITSSKKGKNDGRTIQLLGVKNIAELISHTQTSS